MNNNFRLRQIMAYLYMPLFFTLLGYGILFFSTKPFIDTFISVGSIITGGSTQNIDSNLTIIYDEKKADTVDKDIEAVELQVVEMPNIGAQYAMVSCERVGLNVPLYWGDTSSILKSGMGQYIGTSPPGFGKPLLICGHCTTFCITFQYIEPGDIITIKTNYGTYEYEITSTRVANLNDTSAYNLTQNNEELIMYTCNLFTAAGRNDERLFIYGDKISGPSVRGVE